MRAGAFALLGALACGCARTSAPRAAAVTAAPPCPRTVATLVELRALRPDARCADARVAGHHAPFDGGGGDFRFDAASLEPDDDGVVVAPSDGARGRWRRAHGPTLEARWFGARGDGATPDRPALQAALDAAARLPHGGVVHLAEGRYAITGYLDLRSRVRLEGDGATRSVIVMTNGGRPAKGLANSTAIHGFAIAHLGVTSDVAEGAELLALGALGQPVRDGRLSNLRLWNAQWGLFIEGIDERTPSSRIAVDRVWVSQIRAFHELGGVGAWLFRGCRAMRLSRLTVEDVDADGLSIDAGSTGGGAANVDVAVRGLTVTRFAQRTAGAGIDVQGSRACSVEDYALDAGLDRPPPYNVYGVVVQQDNAPGGAPSLDNRFRHGVIRRVKTAVAAFSSARNTFTDLRVEAPLDAAAYALVFSDSNSYGRVRADTTDNRVDGYRPAGGGDVRVLFQSFTRGVRCEGNVVELARGVTAGTRLVAREADEGRGLGWNAVREGPRAAPELRP